MWTWTRWAGKHIASTLSSIVAIGLTRIIARIYDPRQIDWSSADRTASRAEEVQITGRLSPGPMTAPTLPSGFDIAKHIQLNRADCHITTGFDRQKDITRFLVQLHYKVESNPVKWKAIAWMDHNEISTLGHDVYREGLHVDIARRSRPTVHLKLRHESLPSSRGRVVRACAGYLSRESDYFIDVFREDLPPGRPPGWSPDGGAPSLKFICDNSIDGDMSHEPPVPEALTLRELSEVLAEAEGSSAEEIERGAAEIDIGPPEEATVVSDE